MLLRRVIGDALRARRQGQHRTLREISTAANVSLGYLSEIERGQKEASSELLAAICDALGSQLSDVLREASDTLARSERPALVEALRPDGERPEPVVPAQPVPRERATPPATAPVLGSGAAATAHHPQARKITDGTVSVSVRRYGPLRTTLHAVRTDQSRRPPVASH